MRRRRSPGGPRAARSWCSGATNAVGPRGCPSADRGDRRTPRRALGKLHDERRRPPTRARRRRRGWRPPPSARGRDGYPRPGRAGVPAAMTTRSETTSDAECTASATSAEDANANPAANFTTARTASTAVPIAAVHTTVLKYSTSDADVSLLSRSSRGTHHSPHCLSSWSSGRSPEEDARESQSSSRASGSSFPPREKVRTAAGASEAAAGVFAPLMRRGSIQGRAGAGARALADTNESRRGAVAYDGRVRWATSASLRPESRGNIRLFPLGRVWGFGTA